jgi:hypothetical protein
MRPVGFDEAVCPRDHRFYRACGSAQNANTPPLTRSTDEGDIGAP